MSSPNAPSIGIQVSAGSSRSSSNASEDQVTQRGSMVNAGGAVVLAATGTAPDSGNLTVAGSNIGGNDVILAAQNQVNLANTTNTDSTR